MGRIRSQHGAYRIPEPEKWNERAGIRLGEGQRDDDRGTDWRTDLYRYLGAGFPGRPQKAAVYATTAASVSHDRNGLYGAAFIAGCIAAAFETSDVDRLIEIGLSLIPEESDYARVVRDVVRFRNEEPDDWRACIAYLQQNWGYDKFPGVCHIIPNAGVCVMALLYGRSFARAVEIATMAGWDTDCNAGNVGTIMGVANGLDGKIGRAHV